MRLSAQLDVTFDDFLVIFDFLIELSSESRVFVCLFVFLFVCLFVSLFVCLFVCIAL